MHQSFDDYYWVWVVGIAVAAIALFYLSLKTTGLLEKVISHRLRGGQKSVNPKSAGAPNAAKDKNRCKSF